MRSAAERMRELRRRQRDGLIQVTAIVPRDRLILALQEDGFLRQWDDDRAAIDAAFGEMVEAFCTVMLGPEVL